MARMHFIAPAGTRPPGKRRSGGLCITFAAAMAAVAGAVVIVAIPQPLASAMPAPSSLPPFASTAQR